LLDRDTLNEEKSNIEKFGCTLGKGNIEILNEKITEATFILNDKQLTLKLKINIETAIRQLEDVALEIYETAWQDLFELSKNFE
jgi:hypothetical protein